jgi:hypothetical protein
MNFTDPKITEIYCLTDDFCKEFNAALSLITLGSKPQKAPVINSGEVITIMILFNFVDSTPLMVCKNKRIKRNKVFKGIAKVGKSTMGYFYGFKLHLVINEKGEIINFVITQANVDYREPLKNKRFIKKLSGKLYGDKGYVSAPLAQQLIIDGIALITGIRNNMKNILMEMSDKILLRKRSIIETVNDELKNICPIEHSRHRSFGNFISNTLAAIATYCFFPKKPTIRFDNNSIDLINTNY